MDHHQTTTDKNKATDTISGVGIRGSMPQYSEGIGMKRRTSIGSQGLVQPIPSGKPESLSNQSFSQAPSEPPESVDNHLASDSQNQIGTLLVGGEGGKIGSAEHAREGSAASAGIVIFALLGICLCVLSIYLCFVAFKKRLLLEREKKGKGGGQPDKQTKETPTAIIVQESIEGDDSDSDNGASFNDLENSPHSSSTYSRDSWQSFKGDEDQSTLDKEDSNFIDANINKLGKRHSVLNVHRCASATCVCRKQGKNIHFYGTKPRGAEPVVPTDRHEAEAWFRARARAHLYVNQTNPTRQRQEAERYCEQISMPSATNYDTHSHLIQQNLGFTRERSYEEALRDSLSSKSADSLSLDTSVISGESDHFSDEYSGKGNTSVTAKELLYRQGLASRMCVANSKEMNRLASDASRRDRAGSVLNTKESPSEDDESVSEYALNREDDFTVDTVSDYVLGRPDEQMAERMAINNSVQRNQSEEGKLVRRSMGHTGACIKYGDDDSESHLLAVMYGSGEGIRGRDERSPTAGGSVHERRRPSSFEKQHSLGQRIPPQHLIEYEE